VITGGSAGIGQEVARRLSADGADIAVADVNPADETKASVEANGQRFVSAIVDVSDETQINAFAETVRNELGPVDIVVNNAAVVLLADFDHVTVEEWTKTFSVNVTGAFLTVKAFVADLKKSNAGRVINMSSGTYWAPPPPFISYVSAKGALNGFTHVLATNLAPHDVTVNAVAPGLVRTESALQNTSEQFFDMTVQMQDLKRQGTPTDVANIVAFLASDDSSFITGQIIAADGGLSRR
jgi:NAD(P)-dependent dehydrogenase (short-subunit alcohol dehydrogenase family)